ncbi:hypothetical protein SAICODRAFT_10400 [Saitoella complicata NRRL Y-17804]|uniref:uncharacterized protein n=1 Tax=Saitoella complicata (strain BCRC 22490 / CBS 7301 / JCM 7358 / NBRC 10748 / NRRL Y-17804) TaxID=698492 RepID=UPI00086693A2|nr:uncharacterized protein SAICODRAFT_10400 [Saitoella complicata NRRL Y-17804]ODQ49871.1 hypothetical protein SAICODRAFT_10400 [Saitoella complicata NRRL Y-17804]
MFPEKVWPEGFDPAARGEKVKVIHTDGRVSPGYYHTHEPEPGSKIVIYSPRILQRWRNKFWEWEDSRAQARRAKRGRIHATAETVQTVGKWACFGPVAFAVLPAVLSVCCVWKTGKAIKNAEPEVGGGVLARRMGHGDGGLRTAGEVDAFGWRGRCLEGWSGGWRGLCFESVSVGKALVTHWTA